MLSFYQAYFRENLARKTRRRLLKNDGYNRMHFLLITIVSKSYTKVPLDL